LEKTAITYELEGLEKKENQPSHEMGLVREDVKGMSAVDENSLDMHVIMEMIVEIEDGMKRSSAQLAVLKKIVRMKQKLGKKKDEKVEWKRVVGWTERRPGANAGEAGYLKGDMVKIKNRVEFKEMKKPVKEWNVHGEVVDVEKRFVIVCCENPEGRNERVPREPHNIELMEN